MKNLLFILLTLLLNVISYAQTPDVLKREYEYDLAGNRVLRMVVLLDDGSPGHKSMSNKSDSAQHDFLTDKAGDISLKVFPNPTTSTVTLEVDSKTEAIDGTISIHTLQGSTIHTQTFKSYVTDIDLSIYTSGTYLINVYVNGKATYWKIIKQ
jgi:hypothetical protein